MEKLFVKIYEFLKPKCWLVYTLILASVALFGFYASKVEFEEDISKLLPATDTESSSGLVFSDLKVKDKIFIQIVAKEERCVGIEQMTEICDRFMSELLVRDTATHYIADALYRIDDDLMINGLDYLLAYLPTFVDTTMYAHFDSLLTDEAVACRMAKNYDLLFNEGRTELLDLVQQDPAGLRYAFLEAGVLDNLKGAGFSVVDGHLFSPDSIVAMSFISPNLSSMDSKTGTKLVELIEQVRDEVEAEYTDIDIYFHGAPVQSVFNSRQIKSDLLMTIGISLIVICVVICLCFRNWNTLLLLLMPVGYGALFALACIYWIQGGMSLMAMGIGAIVLGVALSYVLHVLTHYKHVTDPIRVIREQTIPVILGCITTIGAFVGLMFTDSPLLADFGMFASLALVGTVLFSLLFLPHFFDENNNQKSHKAFAIIGKINSYPLDRKRWFVFLLIALSIVCFFTSRWVTFDSDLKNIGYTDPEVRISQELYADKINHGNKSMYYASTAKSLDEAIEYNAQLMKVADSLQSVGVIDSYGKMSSVLLPNAVQQQRIDHWRNYWNDERIKQVMNTINHEGERVGFRAGTFDIFETILRADYQPGSIYESGVLPDGLMSNIVEFTDENYIVFTSVLMSLDKQTEVNDIMASVPHTVVVDPFYYTNNMVEVLSDDFNTVLGISSFFVFIVLLLSYRSISRALLAFMPMFLSWDIVQGIMGIFGLQFNLINIVISSFIFGVGVDYSIFIMDGLFANTRRDDITLLLYHKTAIFLSAFVLIVVTGSLVFATHPAMRSIGVTTLIGMSATILLAYTLQPFVYRLLMKNKMLAHKFGRKPQFKR